jgi:hypothetical protein
MKEQHMNIVDKALETQIKNMQARAGKSLDELFEIIRKSGLVKFGEIREMLKNDLGMGHGDANTLVHAYVAAAAEPQAEGGGDVLDSIYSGPKAGLRPIHDKLMSLISKFGPFEIAPKKAYISLRRKKQFATIGPASKTRVEVGLNMKGVPATSRLVALPPGGMCQYKINVTEAGEVDDELIGWIRQAYDSAE